MTTKQKITEQREDRHAHQEEFRPIPVTSPVDRPLAFSLRCLVDLQLATIVQYLRPALAGLNGRVIDVGAGESPWRGWLPPHASYQGIDINSAANFRMSVQHHDVIYYDGNIMPFADGTFDAALCIEVLEHVPDPDLLLRETHRILQAGAPFILTVPWSARRHHIPYDFHRFTPESLGRMLSDAGFVNINIRERGNDIGAIANKLTLLTLRLLSPKRYWHGLMTWPLGLVCGLLATSFIVAAHLSFAFGLGSKDDPLGYFVMAQKQ